MDVQQKIKLNSSKVRAKESDRPKLIEDFRDSLQVCRELELGLMPATFRSTQCNAASCGVLPPPPRPFEDYMLVTETCEE